MAEHKTVDLEHIPAEGWSLLDVGEKTIAAINGKLDECKTLVWNGPLGVFEMKPFDNATNKVAQHAAELPTNLPTFRRPAARFWNGWKAKSFLALLYLQNNQKSR